MKRIRIILIFSLVLFSDKLVYASAGNVSASLDPSYILIAAAILGLGLFHFVEK